MLPKNLPYTFFVVTEVFRVKNLSGLHLHPCNDHNHLADYSVVLGVGEKKKKKRKEKGYWRDLTLDTKVSRVLASTTVSGRAFQSMIVCGKNEPLRY